ncbi:MAG: exodeoxyribonuclease III [Asgard group archaeon]|nr:exodeoxyribonuclease III [Asgard group archaeon]
MKELKLISWNVNGIRALVRKGKEKELLKGVGFYSWVKTESPDIICLQETKAHPEQVPDELLNLEGYHSIWSAAERKGYSGVVTYTKEKPISTTTELGKNHLDIEGRHVITEYPNFVLINSYFPNGKKNQERLDYKMEYYKVFLKYIEDLRKKGKSIIFCGDVNTAHKPIDLTHPKGNEKISGFLPIEREWIDEVIENGYIDTFRHLYPDKKEVYTWWSIRSISADGKNARDRNVGWRLDYFFVSDNIISNVIDSYMLNDVMGSDHCPVVLKIKF